MEWSEPVRPENIRRPVFGALLWATALRLFHLGAESLWYDETRIVIQTNRSFAETVALVVNRIQHPPAFHLLLNLFTRLTGTSDFAVRFLPAIFGVATVAAAYALGKVVAGQKVGLFSALILATLPFHVKYAQEARMYAALCFFAAVSAWLLIAALRRPAALPRLWAAWVIATTLMLYTHYYGLLFFGGEVLAMLWWAMRSPRWRAQWRGAALAMALPAGLFLPWVPVMLRQPHAPSPLPYGQAYGAVLPLLTIGRFFVGKPFHTWSLTLAGVVLLAAAGNGWLAYKRAGDVGHGKQTVEAVAILAVAPFVAAWIISFWQPVFLPRGLLVSLPAFVVLLAYAFAQPWSVGGKWTRLAMALALAMVLADGLHSYYTAPQKDRWRETAATVSANRQADDLIWTLDTYTARGFDYYYSGEKRIVVPPEVYARGDSADAATLDRLLQGHNRLWLVRTENGKDFEDFLRHGYGRTHLIRGWDFPAEMTSIHLSLFGVGNGQ